MNFLHVSIDADSCGDGQYYFLIPCALWNEDNAGEIDFHNKHTNPRGRQSAIEEARIGTLSNSAPRQLNSPSRLTTPQRNWHVASEEELARWCSLHPLLCRLGTWPMNPRWTPDNITDSSPFRKGAHSSAREPMSWEGYPHHTSSKYHKVMLDTSAYMVAWNKTYLLSRNLHLTMVQQEVGVAPAGTLVP